MWIFKKKLSEEEFQKFKRGVRRSFKKVKTDHRILENRITVLDKGLNELRPLSKRFTELQHQFTELLKQFSSGSLNRQEEVSKLSFQNRETKKHSSFEFTEKQTRNLSQLEQKGLIFIGRLQNEMSGHWIPVGSLTSNLYPDRINRQIKTTVSNILKKLIELGLVNRERRGNYWYVGLTNKGYLMAKQTLNQNQLKNLTQLYNRR